MIGEVSYNVRKAFVEALNAGNINVNGVVIPVYSEQVPQNETVANVTYKNQKGKAYIIIQGQFENESGDQTMCNYTLNSYISIRIVTTFVSGGRKDISEHIADQVYKALFYDWRNTKVTSNEVSIQDVRIEPTNFTFESAGEQTAYTKILTFNTIINL